MRRGAGGAAHGASVRPGAEEHFEARSQAPESLDAALCSHAPEEILSQPDGQDLVLRNEQQCWFYVEFKRLKLVVVHKRICFKSRRPGRQTQGCPSHLFKNVSRETKQKTP